MSRPILSIHALPLVLVALVLSACVSMGNYAGTPDVLGRGEVAVGVDLASVGLVSLEEEGGVALASAAGISGRRGLGGGLEGGLHLSGSPFFANATALSKVSIGDQDRELRLAFAPSLGLVLMRDITVRGEPLDRRAFVHTQLPLLIGWRPLGVDNVDVVVAPKVGNWTLGTWSMGVSTGVALGSPGFQVMPELSASVPVAPGGPATVELALHLIARAPSR